MKKVLSEQEYQEVEELLDKLFLAKPGSEGEKKFRELTQLLRNYHAGSSATSADKPTFTIPPFPHD